jgi:UDP-glucuronate 4-epimerase
MKRTILLTGAAGFIGYHLAAKLAEKGDQLICLDNFNSYYSPALKKKRAALLEQQNVPVIEADINTPGVLASLVKEKKPSHIVHLAAQPGVRYSLANPHAYVETNISGFLNVLEACRQRREMKLIYASSSSVYGNNSKIPFSYEDRTDQPANIYGVTKKCNELMASAYHHLYSITAIGLRFFTVYGPWGRPDMAYYSFCKAIMEGKPIDVYNHGNMQRDFTYIDDIIQGIVASLEYEQEGCALFNLGNNRSEPLMHLIQLLEEHLGKKARLNLLPMQLGDVERTYADISASQKALNFHPTTPLAQGIPKFVEWYKAFH